MSINQGGPIDRNQDHRLDIRGLSQASAESLEFKLRTLVLVTQS